MTVASLLTLGACGELPPAEQARLDAQIACSERASALFQIIALMQEPGPAGEGETDNFQVEPTGDFTWAVIAKGKNRPLADRLYCAGNINGRKIDVVEFNGVKKHPSAQEVWKY